MGSSWSYDPSLAMARSPTPREGFASRDGFSTALVPLLCTWWGSVPVLGGVYRT